MPLERAERTKTQVCLGGILALGFSSHFFGVAGHDGFRPDDLVVFALIVVCLGFAGGYGIAAPLDSCTRFIQAWRGSTRAERQSGEYPVDREER